MNLLPIIVFVVVLLALFGIMALACRNAPEGWEDGSGFHYGKRP